MRKTTLYLLLSILCVPLFSMEHRLQSPDEKLEVIVSHYTGSLLYKVMYNQKTIIEYSPLGLITNIASLDKNLDFVSMKQSLVDIEYELNRAKQSKVHYLANETLLTYKNNKDKEFSILFRVSNNDIAFKYIIPQYGETACCVVERELTGFQFPQNTTTFLTPQTPPMIGWKRTKPSYEEKYIADEPIGTPSQYGEGYTFPALFRIGHEGWALLSETGVSSLYCGSHLSEGTPSGLYSVAYPHEGENNGLGSSTPGISLPGETPWRTITVGDNLKPIVETTVSFDVVDQLYEPSQNYKFGRSTWSWIMWQDESINYDDQIRYIDLASDLGYEYTLIDGLWDKQIGYEGMISLFEYAQSKGIDLFVWYNSNGYWNDAPQGAKQCMSNSIARKREMKWLQSNGVKGVKIDFFGGDKQETIKLYEDILADANEYGLMVVFHGCTLPRGWDKMYPNFVGSEAVLASENLIFNQEANDDEAFNACLHPFIRNTVGSMEFGPVLLNNRHNRTNDGGKIRRTTDIFQLATAVLYQNPLQMFALTPNNLIEQPNFEIDFMKKVPTVWDETVFIDGYPGQYCILGRRAADKWYIVAVNAKKELLKVKVNLSFLAGQEVVIYYDNSKREPQMKLSKVKSNGDYTIEVQPDGGFIITGFK